MIAPLDSPMVRLLSVADSGGRRVSRTAPGRSRRPSVAIAADRSGGDGRRNRRSAASASGCSGSRSASSKSTTASNAPPSRIQALTAPGACFARRVPGAGQEGLVPNGVSVAPKILMPRAVGAHRHLLQAGDHLLGGDLLLGLGPAVAQIVGAEHDDHMGDAGLRQHVAVEAAQAAVAADVVQDAVAAEALVHDADRPAAARERGGAPAGRASGRTRRSSRCWRRSASRRARRCRRSRAAPARRRRRRRTSRRSACRPASRPSAAKSPGGEM